MNKNLKKIIAVTIAFCSVSAVLNNRNLNVLGEGITAAYASDKSSLNLESISLSTGNIDFSSSKTSYKVYLNKAVKNIDIKATPEGSDKKIRVTINGESVSSNDNYKDNFKLSIGENVFKIKIENKDDESLSKTYTLTVYRGTDENGQDIEQNLYLDYLTINNKEITLSKDKKIYDYKVKSDVKEVKLVIEPEQDYYDVKINNDKCKNEGRIKKTITLNEGKNEIKIKLTDGEDEEKQQKTYTINVYRGIDVPSANITNIHNGTESNVEANNAGTSTSGSENLNPSVTIESQLTTQISQNGKWQQTLNGKWYYTDSQGNVAKNKWFFVQADGTMATGWMNISGNWYYLNDNGIMETGWLSNGGKWYYFDSNGVMMKGWNEIDGKWYYLNSDGSMASNTTIDNYKLGSDGAWIK
ncbi:N-acetylmuramoyl-L-alanine amidase family protein [uncultured Clostridium sp.]|uniref:N-acetylmuramoyl-L-alanine amidase family protein n=1 Tax=uncultured Clostridium sp. TaxID=59620 RepID=UPI0025FB2CD9|nr:cadherin-like beta sandwich domain-containing protein [uncultured Clostridium sp.]